MQQASLVPTSRLNNLLDNQQRKVLKNINYKISFVDNRSPEELILPTGGVIQIKNRLICPVTKKRAIIFDDSMVEENGKKIVGVYEIINQDEIHFITQEAIKQEQKRDCKYVVSGNKKLLERLVEEAFGTDCL